MHYSFSTCSLLTPKDKRGPILKMNEMNICTCSLLTPRNKKDPILQVGEMRICSLQPQIYRKVNKSEENMTILFQKWSNLTNCLLMLKELPIDVFSILQDTPYHFN